MATSTVAALQKLLKTKYDPEWRTAFKEAYLLWQLAKPQTRSFDGDKEIFGVEIARSSGTGFRGERGSGGGLYGLPNPQPTPIENGYVGIKRLFATMEWTHDIIERSRTNTGAFKRAIDLEVRAKFSRMLFDACFAGYGNGDGVRCTVKGNSGTVTIATTAAANVKVDTTRYLTRKDPIALWQGGDPNAVVANGGQDAASAELVVVEKVVDEKTLYIRNNGPNSVTFTNDDTIRLFGDAEIVSAARVDNVFDGLGMAIDDGTVATTYAGISRTDWPEWAAKVVDAANTDLDEDIIIRAVDGTERRCGEKVDTIIWDVSLRRDYVSLTKPDRRYAPVKDTDPGYSADSDETLVLTAGSRKIKLREDTMFPYGTLVGLTKRNLEYYELSPMQLDESTGAVLKQGVPYGKAGVGDVFYAYARAKGNFALTRPYASFRIKNLNYTLE